MNTVRAILKQKGKNVVSVKPTDPLAEALLKLTQYKIGAVLVLDDEKKITGILSERDVVRNLAGKVEYNTTIPVSDVMTKCVTYVKLHQTTEECLQLMTQGRFRHLPVVEEEKVVGIISIGDVVKATLENRAFEIGQLEYYIANTY